MAVQQDMESVQATNRSVCIDELWDMAEKKFPGKMMVLYDELLLKLDKFGDRRSLLKEVTVEELKLDQISSQLAETTLNNYTPHFNSMYLAHFPTSKKTTDSQFGSFCHKYMRLGEIDGKGKGQGYDAKLHNVKNSFTSSKSLQLALLINHLLGVQIDGKSASVSIFDSADSEQSCMRPLFEPVKSIINRLFAFTSSFGLTVKAGFELTTLEGTGRPDFGVTVDTLYKGAKTPKTECVSVVEFKRPNSGLWIPFGPLTGQKWTEDEEAAFFQLKELELEFDKEKKKSPSSLRKEIKELPVFLQGQTEKLLSSWQKRHLWDSAKRVLARIGSNRVRVVYSRNTQNDGLAGSTTSAQGGENLTSFYYIETADGKREDITELLKAAKFKTSFDSCHDGLAQGTAYGVLNKCNKVLTADGLTVIAGSLNKLEKSKISDDNPDNSDDALDAHFYSMYMMQTHDQDSLVHILNYFAECVLLHSNLKSLVRQLLLFSDPKGHKKDPKIAAQELYTKLSGHEFNFSRENPRVQFPAWEESLLALTKGAREAVVKALVDICEKFPELKPKIGRITSNSFNVVEWYRRDMYEGFESDEPLFPGRSKSVARVQRHVDKHGTHLVLKEYYPDQDSVARMKLELEAYRRVSKLPEDKRTKHVANLVSFGSLDLGEVPRLFLMFEYVEDSESDTLMADQSLISAEVGKVNRLLKSVGVNHNDLEDRNYKLQLDLDGSWYIKAFDFDHANFSSP